MLLSRSTAKDGEVIYLFWCPGCESAHFARTVPSTTRAPEDNHVWTFNNNFEKPTFSPSILPRYAPEEKRTCHFFIVDGNINYCGDCTHKYSGQSIPMVDWDEYRRLSEMKPHLLVGTYNDKTDTRGFLFRCPGCLNHGKLTGIHFVQTHGPGLNWTWNKNWDKPTFYPSLAVNFGAPLGVCHFNIVDGIIIYHEDSFHYEKTLAAFGDNKIEMIDYELRPIGDDGLCPSDNSYGLRSE